MLTLLFNLGQQPASATGYNDYMARMGQYAGYGYDSARWTTAQTAELDRYVDEARNYVLYPSTIPGERVGHTWTFMEQLYALTTEDAEYEYDLPGNYGSPNGDITFASGTGFGPICQTSEQILRQKRTWTARTGRPEMYAIRWAAQANGLSQFRKIQFYPTPDGAYALTVPFVLLCNKLSAARPFMPGGPRIEQLMIEACKAIGEASKNGQRGDQWGIFIDRLHAAIMIDKGTNTEPTVGFMRGSAGEYTGRKLINSVSYWYGPDSSGNYSLEV